MAAVACAQPPRRTVTFADLPPQHQREVVRVSLAAAATSALFITLAIVTRPIPSRSFVATGTVPYFIVTPQPVRIVTAPAAAAVASLAVPDAFTAHNPGGMAPLRVSTVRPRDGVLLASLRESPDITRSESSPDRKRRRNVFSRFFRGMLRGFQPAAVKADAS